MVKCRIISVDSPAIIPPWSDRAALYGYREPSPEHTSVHFECTENDALLQESYALLDMRNKKDCIIDYFEVSEPGEGWGSKVYPFLEDFMKEKRCKKSSLYAFQGSEPFWRRMGYNRITPYEEYYEKVLEEP